MVGGGFVIVVGNIGFIFEIWVEIGIILNN